MYDISDQFTAEQAREERDKLTGWQDALREMERELGDNPDLSDDINVYALEAVKMSVSAAREARSQSLSRYEGEPPSASRPPPNHGGARC